MNFIAYAYTATSRVVHVPEGHVTSTAISLVVHIAYTGTSGWYVIYQTLSPSLGRRGWRARLA